jgi:uncharacterized repeat protein (TIGR01451 family)
MILRTKLAIGAAVAAVGSAYLGLGAADALTLDADLEVTTTPEKVVADPGSYLDYFIQVKNNGPSSASNVELQDSQISGIFTSIAPTPATTNGECKRLTRTSISCNLGTIPAGETAIIMIRASILTVPPRPDMEREPARSVATVKYDHDPIQQNNTSQITVPVQEPGEITNAELQPMVEVAKACAGAVTKTPFVGVVTDAYGNPNRGELISAAASEVMLEAVRDETKRAWLSGSLAVPNCVMHLISFWGSVDGSTPLGTGQKPIEKTEIRRKAEEALRKAGAHPEKQNQIEGQTPTDDPTPTKEPREIVNPRTAIDPTSGRPGSTPDLSGGGFYPNKDVTITESGPAGSRTVGTITADASGRFDTTLQIADSTPEGQITFTFRQVPDVKVTDTFYVWVPAIEGAPRDEVPPTKEERQKDEQQQQLEELQKQHQRDEEQQSQEQQSQQNQEQQSQQQQNHEQQSQQNQEQQSQQQQNQQQGPVPFYTLGPKS